jgi:predicted dehydrogenase
MLRTQAAKAPTVRGLKIAAHRRGAFFATRRDGRAFPRPGFVTAPRRALSCVHADRPPPILRPRAIRPCKAGLSMRVGVIGTGAIGAWHARIVAESGDALSAVCDLVPARAEAAAFGAQVFTDHDAFFASGLDAVIVATPEAQHEAHVIAAARAGLAVMVEKPVAPDMAAMRRMADAVADAGVIAMAAHVERFEAGSAGLKAAIDQGICGRVSAIFARRQFGPAEVARFAGSSSTLRVLGIHDFDLVRWLHPGRITSVQAMAGRGAIHAAHGMDDHVVTTITFADGAMACVESGWTLPLAYQSYATPEGWGAAGQQPAGGFRRRGASCRTTCRSGPSR